VIEPVFVCHCKKNAILTTLLMARLRKSGNLCIMQLSEFEMQAVERIANLIQRRPKLSDDEAALACLVGMTPYHLTRSFLQYHGASLRQFAHDSNRDSDRCHKATADWVLLAL
jgi:transcriptional regulator GlxA family with amidase domain